MLQIFSTFFLEWTVGNWERTEERLQPKAVILLDRLLWNTTTPLDHTNNKHAFLVILLAVRLCRVERYWSFIQFAKTRQ